MGHASWYLLHYEIMKLLYNIQSYLSHKTLSLHHFNCFRYIYVPIVKTSHLNNKILASLACFTFVYIWHGLDSYILIWVIMNFIGIVIENSCTAIYKQHLDNSKIEEFVGKQWMRRISCFLASFLLAMSAISNFYFFSSVSIGTVFLKRVLNGEFHCILGRFYLCFLKLYIILKSSIICMCFIWVV